MRIPSRFPLLLSFLAVAACADTPTGIAPDGIPFEPDRDETTERVDPIAWAANHQEKEVRRTSWALARFVPCANGGAGEWVDIDGELLYQLKVMQDGAGGWHLREHTQLSHASGVGRITGDVYRAPGGTHAKWNSNGMGEQDSYTANYRLVAIGGGAHFQLLVTSRYVVNANGEIVRQDEGWEVRCM